MASSQFFMVRALQKKVKDLKHENDELRAQLEHYKTERLYIEDAIPSGEDTHDS